MENTVLKNYGISIDKIKEIKKGYSSKKWIISENKNKYVVKVLSKEQYKNFPFALEIQNELMDYSSKILKTFDGKLCLSYGDSILYISEFLNSELHKFTSHELGLFLGCLHKKMSEIKYNRIVDYIEYNDNLSVINDLLCSNCSNEIKKTLELKKKILKSMKKEKIDFSKLNMQIIHGDYYDENILWVNGKCKIIDFDQCCVFYREYELLRGFFISIFDSNKKVSENIEELSHYISGYNEKIKYVDSINAYNLYLYIQANSLSGIKRNFQDLYFANKKYKILVFLLENKEEIIKIIGQKQ